METNDEIIQLKDWVQTVYNNHRQLNQKIGILTDSLNRLAVQLSELTSVVMTLNQKMKNMTPQHVDKKKFTDSIRVVDFDNKFIGGSFRVGDMR